MLSVETKRSLRTVAIAGAIGTLVAFLVLDRPRSSSGYGLAVGTVAPAFALSPLAGGAKVALDATQGRTTLVLFWATWCKACRAELPAIQRLHEDLASDGLVVLSVVDEPPVAVKSFLDAHARGGQPITFPVLLDQGGRTHVAYGARALPLAVTVGGDGRVLRTIVGAPSEEDLREAVQEDLRSAAAPAAEAAQAALALDRGPSPSTPCVVASSPRRRVLARRWALVGGVARRSAAA